MVEEKISIEEEIYNLCYEAEKINKEISKKLKKKIDVEKINYIDKKIFKIQKYINNCELAFELNSSKNQIKDKLTVILNAYNTVQQVLTDDPNNVDEMNNRLDSIINSIKEFEQYLIFFIDLTGTMSKEGIKNSIASYKRNLNEITDEIEELKQTTQLKFDGIIEDNIKKIEEFNSYQESIKNDIETNNNEFNKRIDELQEQIDNKNTELETLKNNYNDELSNIKDTYDQEFNNMRNQAINDFEKLKKEIESKDKKISELIGLIGNKANIGEYKSNADKAHKERIVWQISTVVIFVVAFAMMCFITLKTKDYNITTLAKYIVSVILLGMSGYTAKQASNQRKDEIYFRKQQLELSSMDVYLDDLPDNIKQAIKQDLSNKIFGQAKDTYKSKYDESANGSVDKLITVIEKLINHSKNN